MSGKCGGTPAKRKLQSLYLTNKPQRKTMRQKARIGRISGEERASKHTDGDGKEGQDKQAMAFTYLVNIVCGPV